MFAVILTPNDLPRGVRLIAEYSLNRDATNVSVVEHTAPLAFAFTQGEEAVSAATLQEGLDLARQWVELNSSAPGY